MTPKISILCLNLNGGQYIWRCINSIISQSYKNWELIIADGGSIDNSFEIIQSFNSSKIIVLPGPDGGRYDGINKALNAASGELIMVTTSSDGYIDTKWFELAVNELSSNAKLSLVWGGYTGMVEDKLNFQFGPDIGRHSETELRIFENWMSNDRMGLDKTYFPELNYCVKSTVYKQCSSLSADFPELDNADPILRFHFQFLKNGYCSKYINTIANFGRTHTNQFQFSQTQLNSISAYYTALEKYKSKIFNKDEIHYFRASDGTPFMQVNV